MDCIWFNFLVKYLYYLYYCGVKRTEPYSGSKRFLD